MIATEEEHVCSTVATFEKLLLDVANSTCDNAGLWKNDNIIRMTLIYLNSHQLPLLPNVI